MALQHLRSNTASKRPTAGAMSDGQIAINTNATSTGLFFKDAGGAIIKVGPVHVGTTAPNSSPAGSTGNSLGEQWLDTSGGGYVLKIWDGSAWRSEVGEFVDAAGDTMTGALILPSGTAAAPALGVGSTDNGVYSPGADQVALSTNGTEALRINSAGDALFFGNVRKDNAFSSLILSGGNGSESGANIVLNGQSGSPANTIQFRYGSNESMRIDSSGRLGIGTSSPRTLFNIASPTGPSLTIENTETSITGSDTYGSIDWYGNDATTGASGIRAQIQVLSRGSSGECALDFGTSSAGNAIQTRMRIDRTGFVGIGTILPDQLLDIAASTDATIQLKSTKTGAAVNDVLGTIAYYGSDGSGPGAGVKSSITSTAQGTGGAGSDLRFHTTNSAGSNNTEKVRIDEQGNVGIGTTSPGGALDVVAGNTSNYAITANNSNSSGDQNFLQFKAGPTIIGDFNRPTGTNDVEFNAGYGAVAFGTGSSGTATEKARIDSSGRLLVGTSTARSNLFTSVSPSSQVEGTDASTSSLGLTCNNTNTGGTSILAFCKSAGSSVGSNTLVANNHKLGQIDFLGSDGSNFTSGARINAEVDGTPGANDMPGRLVFSTTADGASSPTERMRIGNDGTITFNFTGAVYEAVTFSHTATYGNGTLQIQPVTFPGSGTAQFYTHFADKVSGGTTKHNVVIGGSLSKGSGSFRIPHPLKPETHELVHSFIEGPQADLIYRGHIQLVNGAATVNIDEAARMTEGTFEALCTNVCCFTSNESDWTAVRGSVSGNILTIEAQDPTSTAEVCWMVIGERKDPHMIETDWTDENGRVITEPLKHQ